MARAAIIQDNTFADFHGTARIPALKSLRSLKKLTPSTYCPIANIHPKERWLFENKNAMEHLLEGLDDSKEGKVTHGGDFTQYI
jgi:hypothetical protein